MKVIERKQLINMPIYRRPSWRGFGLIVAVFMLFLVLINPYRDFAIEDDWDYARTAQQLLTSGVFQRSQIMTANALFPAMWGALVAKVFGFSFTTLRFSTLGLALGALLLFYGLLGELEIRGSRRIIATLTLLVSPLFLFLAFSFMTDISFLFGLVGALYFSVRALRRQKLRLAFIGSLFGALAFLARQLGVVIPLVFGLLIWFDWPVSIFATRPGRWVRWRWLLTAVGVPLLVLWLYIEWTQFLGGATWADKSRTIDRTWQLWRQPDIAGVLMRRLVQGAVTLGVYLTPLWFGLAPAVVKGWSQWRSSMSWRKIIVPGMLAVVFAAVVIRLASRDEWFPYLPDQLTRYGLRPYLAFAAYTLNIQRPLVFPLSFSVILTGWGAMTGLMICYWAVRRMAGRLSTELSLVYGTTLALALGTLTFFSFYEHYLLALLPGVIILVFDTSKRWSFLTHSSAVGLLLIAIGSLALMQDYFAFTELKWNTAQALRQAGVPLQQIDAGFEWDGWHLYDESLAYIQAHHVPMQITPWEYIWDPQYIFAFEVVPGYRLEKRLVFSTPLRPDGSDLILLLRRVRKPEFDQGGDKRTSRLSTKSSARTHPTLVGPVKG